MRGTSDKRKSGRRRKHSGKKRKNIRILLFAIVMVILVPAAAAGIYTFTPTSKTMDLQEYFGSSGETGKCTIIIDGMAYPDAGTIVDSEVYVDAGWVREHLTTRFYEDSESDAVLFTDGDGTWEYRAGQTEFTSDDGRKETTDKPVVLSADGQKSLWLAYCLKSADFSASWYFSEDSGQSGAAAAGAARVVLRSGGAQNNTAVLSRGTQLRYRGGIKSPVLASLTQGETVTVLEDLGDWVAVLTEDGITGYVKSRYLSGQQTGTVAHTFDGAYSHVLLGHRIVMGWLTSNRSVLDGDENDPAAAEELNVVSPTWYTISDTAGNVDDTVSDSLITELKSRGLSVWPLISDFTEDVDSKALLSSRAARSSLITRLMADADQYGYDGVNLDFEAVTQESAPDFLQFVRELSVECRKRRIILSTDNYIPVRSREYYNYEEQSDYVDYIIMMDYDEHWSTSEPGSVSSQEFFSTNLTNALEKVDSSQLVCGCPFYTRIYQVSGGESSGREYGMQEALDAVAEAGAALSWDDGVGQYTASWSSGDTQYYAWLEEERSFTLRMQAVKESGCAGAAFWQLGKELPDIWDIVREELG
jgi:spore germination protein YaaH